MDSYCDMKEGTLTNTDEGLGTVYERFMLNNFFDLLIDTHSIKEVLEVPVYGMSGLTGINSVRFAERGCSLTLLDNREDALREARAIWRILPLRPRCEFLQQENLSSLPFADNSFDLVWNFAALWHAENVEQLLAEMARVSSKLLLIVTANRKQPGYILRKYLFDRQFFEAVDERWTKIEDIRSVLTSLGLRLIDQGVIDVPPWPDTCFPLARILDKFRIRGMNKNKDGKKIWTWDIMEYYQGRDPTLKERVERFSFLEKIPVPWRLKSLWAHHRYALYLKTR